LSGGSTGKRAISESTEKEHDRPARAGKPTYTLVEVQALTGLSVHKIKEAVLAAHLTARREGSRYVVDKDSLVNFIVEVTGKTEVRLVSG
jgi:hypothetical protein